MKSSLVMKAAGLIAAIGLASTAFAAAPPARGGGSPSGDLGANLSQKASGLLAEVHQDALAVRDLAGTLEGYNREPFTTDWRDDASTFDRMRPQIDEIDRVVYELRSMEKNLPPAQQAEVNQVVPATLELTNTAQTAIDYLKDNQDRTMFPQFTSYADELYTEAVRIAQTTAPSRP